MLFVDEDDIWGDNEGDIYSMIEFLLGSGC